MDIEVTFPGGARVDAKLGDHVIKTDQPPQGGGEGSAATPFQHFLASLVTCAGIFVLGFCRQRDIPTDDIRLIQSHEVDRSTGMVKRIEVTIELPPDFPEQYKDAVVRSAEICSVKKHLASPPEIDVITT